jgi:trehalose 2-sulfotransferase
VASLLRKFRYPRRCYAVCAVARSGSNLLTDGLHATRRAGRPNQFFCELFEATYAEKYRLNPGNDYAGYIRGIIDATVTSNEIFGFKLMGWYLDSFIGKLRDTHAFGYGEELELLQSAFPRLQLIRIQRRNKLRQAISKARAYQSGQWKVRENESLANNSQFDAELIHRCLDENRREEENWRRFFERTGAEAFMVDYEKLSQDYENTIRAVLAFLRIRVPRQTIIVPETVKQSDATSLEWEERYREMKEPIAAA